MKINKGYIYTIIILFIMMLSISYLSKFFFFAINTTNSIEGTFFIVVRERPHKGRLIAFRPEKNRFYRHRWFVKYYIGGEGDKISFKGRKLYLNGKYLGIAKKKSKTGLKLERTENKIIKKDKYFVWTGHKDSYDSRYKDINTIDSSSIIGNAYRIF